MAKNKVYAVRKGNKTGIFNTWDECSEAVRGYSGAEYKSFSTLEEARRYLDGKPSGGSSKKVYAVRAGNVTGIFNSWEECSASIRGYSGAEYRSFKTYEEANAYMKGKEVCWLDGKAVNVPKPTEDSIVIYTDGTCIEGVLGFGGYVSTVHKDFGFLGIADLPEYRSMKNICSELICALVGVELAIDMGCSGVTLVHDYEGVSKHYTGVFSCNGELQYRYVSVLNSLVKKSGIELGFLKVNAHSGVYGNKMADTYARKAVGEKIYIDTDKVFKGILKSKDIYIL